VDSASDDLLQQHHRQPQREEQLRETRFEAQKLRPPGGPLPDATQQTLLPAPRKLANKAHNH